jgi:sulfur-oxidizing protein SoxZ
VICRRRAEPPRGVPIVPDVQVVFGKWLRKVMAEVGRVSIRLPSSIKQGDVVRVRTLVIHPMEIVQRDKANKIIPKNYFFIHTMTVAYNGKEVMRAELTQAVSQNPSFTFPLKVDKPGKLTVSFSDTEGKVYQGQSDVHFS